MSIHPHYACTTSLGNSRVKMPWQRGLKPGNSFSSLILLYLFSTQSFPFILGKLSLGFGETVSISLGSVYITSFYFSHYSHHVFPKQKLLISWCPMLGSARLRILFLGFSPHTVWIFWMTVINNFRKVYSSLTGIKKCLCSLFIEKNSKSKMLFVNIV